MPVVGSNVTDDVAPLLSIINLTSGIGAAAGLIVTTLLALHPKAEVAVTVTSVDAVNLFVKVYLLLELVVAAKEPIAGQFQYLTLSSSYLATVPVMVDKSVACNVSVASEH